MKMKKNKVKILIFSGIIILIIILNHIFGWSDYLIDMDNFNFLKQMVKENMLWAIFIYTVLTIIGCVILAVPGVTFAVLSGIIFGPILGIITCLVATTLGAAMAFLVARFFMKDAIKPMLEKDKTLKKLLFSNDGKGDIIILMITRMVPLFPYNIQNFAYGITNIGFGKYTIYTFIFMFPGVSFFTIGAAGITAGENKWIYFIISGILAVIVTVSGIMIKKRFLKNKLEERF